MKKIGCIGHDCAACATREKHINKLKQEVERWKSRAKTYMKQRDEQKKMRVVSEQTADLNGDLAESSQAELRRRIRGRRLNAYLEKAA